MVAMQCFSLCRQLFVSNCTFSKNKGWCVSFKVVNYFDSKAKSIQLDEIENSFSFFNCNCEQDENSYHEYYIDDKSEGKIEFLNCYFK